MTGQQTAFERFIDNLRDADCKPKQTSTGWWEARCPVHTDRRPSLGIKPVSGTFIVRCLAGCERPKILAAFDMRDPDMWDEPREARTDSHRPRTNDRWLPCHRNGSAGHGKVAEYHYRDQHGALVFGVTRCEAKDFAQWRPDEESKTGRRWGIKDRETGNWLVQPVPYRLPEALAAIEAGMNVWVVEGEKDADRLATIGIAAVCNNGGAGSANGIRKWTAEHHAVWLKDADVIVVADKDDAGWKHADHVVSTLLPVARSIEVLMAGAGKDVSDHLDAGLKLHQFETIAEPLPAPTAVEGCPDCAREATA